MSARGLPASVICVTLLGLAAGCGGSGGSGAGMDSNDTSTVGHRVTGRDAWDAKTQQLCTQKKAAIASLGDVHITYGGIARLGLPAVKRLLERYLDRLLAVLRQFAGRQRQLTTPPSLVAVMTKIMAVDVQIQASIVRLRAAVVQVTTAGGLSAVFRAWLSTLQQLSGQAEALAVHLNLPACQSQSATASSAAS